MVEVIKGLIFIIFAGSLITGAHAANLHGTVFEWSDFEKPLKNAIIEVNSTPAQYVIATGGTFSFNLSPGSYLVKAKYYRDNILEYCTEEEIRIDREGDFVHDLLLFPPTESEYEVLGDINLTGDIDITNETGDTNYIIFILFFIFIFSFAIIIYLSIKKKTRESVSVSNEPPEPLPVKIEKIDEPKTSDLPPDLSELYKIILDLGGRTTQKEIRKKIKYSEAKVSLMLADLEDRGFIRKIKKGRSNIIIAELSGYSPGNPPF